MLLKYEKRYLMFNKKFKIVLFLGIAIILLIVFGKRIVNEIASVDKISTFTEPTSITYYKKSCRYEDAQVCNELGDMYHYGSNIVSVDYEEAVEYYKRSCELEDGKGCNNLAYMLNKGRGIKKNNWTAIRLYKKACKYEEMEACYNVGSMYYHGEGTKRNYANAAYYFEEACTNGIGAGCNDLGYMHEHGKYVRASTHKAISYYSSACDMGEASGCKNLAYLREQKGHLKPAKQFYIKACTLGDNYSCNRLENFLGNQIYVIKDELALLEAKNACNRSTQGGTMCYRVGLYYEKADEVDKAREFFEKACNRQQSQSCKHLGDLHR
jgi:TPR repeat protein